MNLSFQNISKTQKILLIVIIIIVIIIFITYLVRRKQYMDKYEPLFYNKIQNFPYTQPLNLTENINNSENFNYSIKPSENDIAFTVSTWLYIFNAPNNLNKGKDGFDVPTIVFSIPNGSNNSASPYLSYYQKTGELFINIYAGNELLHYNLGYLKQQHWNHLIIRLTNRNIDFYVDNKIEKSFLLPNVPIVGNKVIKFGNNGGGYMLISSPRYFNRSISDYEIYRLYNTNKNNNPPKENILTWWLPCITPNCWHGIKELLPFSL